MGHHSDRPFSDLSAKLAGLGPTGRFPEGKMSADDEGELKLAIGRKDGKVVMDFGEPTAWIAFPKETAIKLANILMKHAADLE